MAESNVLLLVDKTGGSYYAIAPKLKPGKFNKWKRRMLCYLVGMEPYYIKCIKEGPFQPKNAEGAIKPESQWTNDKRRVVNQDQRFKSIIMSCLPDDIMKSVISSETAKATCTDLEFQENSDDEADGRTSEEYLKDLDNLCHQETTKFRQVTFSEHLQGDSNTTIGDNEAVSLRLLQTEDDNDDEKRFQADLSRVVCQSLNAFHLREKPEERSWVLVTTATVMTAVWLRVFKDRNTNLNMASRSSKGFDFASDDILCSYEDYANQENNNTSHSNSVIAFNSAKEFHKNRMARTSVFPNSTYSSPDDSSSQEVILLAAERLTRETHG
ncbi:hypothetical protein Tco_1427673 [Tanacetum coccineum]